MTSSEPLIPPRLFAIMQCPACAGELTERPEPPALVCGGECGRAYAVVDGIPNMIVEEAVEPDGS
jgi:uncharacterized protein YbaR (Trm112 family)